MKLSIRIFLGLLSIACIAPRLQADTDKFPILDTGKVPADYSQRLVGFAKIEKKTKNRWKTISPAQMVEAGDTLRFVVWTNWYASVKLCWKENNKKQCWPGIEQGFVLDPYKFYSLPSDSVLVIGGNTVSESYTIEMNDLQVTGMRVRDSQIVPSSDDDGQYFWSATGENGTRSANKIIVLERSDVKN